MFLKRFWISGMLLSLWVAMGLAGVDPEGKLDVGTRMVVEMDDTLSWESAKAGDKFKSHLVEPVSVGGKVVAQRGAEVTGAVTAVRKQSRLRGGGDVEVQFESMKLASGEVVEIVAVPKTLFFPEPTSGPAATALNLVGEGQRDLLKKIELPLKGRLFNRRGEQQLAKGTQIEIVLQKAVKIK
ncbi:MAG: hypothetical protein ACR2L2_20760 [Acidobacteriota bacterium]